MGVQPQTLQASLVIASQSTDRTPPTSTISAVSSNSIVEGQTVTVTGTATDTGGGVIGGVQVSTDGGATWHPASGLAGSTAMNWSYSFVAPTPGAHVIQSRAVDDSVNIEMPSPGTSYTVSSSPTLSLFNATTPSIANDPAAVEVGVKFTTQTSGLVTAIRFYKASSNTGTHIGDLWTSSGTLLATATFANETASGWQQVNFSTPVNITPGTAYVASYHTNAGNYADTPYFFATYGGQSNGSLNAPGDSLDGVYAYGANSIFPSGTSVTGDNYWVDVVFNDSGHLPPVLSNVATSASYSAGGLPTNLSPAASVSDPESTTLASGSVSITNGLLAGDALATSTSGTNISANYDPSTGVLTLTGADTLAHYQQVLDGVTYSSSSQNPTNYGVNASRTLSWAVNDGAVSSQAQTTTVNLTGGPAVNSLFGPSATPSTITENDPNAVDLGTKFQSSINGTIVGIRFYKGPQNTGTHIGDLWTTSGALLASATFTNETASGWQQVNFSTPVSITAGTTYIASYETAVGEYSANANYFGSAVTNGPLTAPSDAVSGGNGVYAYGASNAFPNNSYNASNYWVDVAFLPAAQLAFTSVASISGTAQEGSVLTAVNGTTNDPSAVISGYQWQSSSDGTTWTNIGGATKQAYTPVEADETHLLRVVETATDTATAQSGTSTSNATTAVADIALAFTTPPSITGSAAVGSTLTAVKAPLNDAEAAVAGYQWQFSTDGTTWSAISGATNQTYTPVAPDQGHQLRVIETATDADGGPTTTSPPSAATSAVANNTLTFTTQASIPSTAQEGAVLTAVNASSSDPGAVISGYQWQSSSDGTTWTNIGGATKQAYTPVEADETHLLRVVETATDTATAQIGTSTSNATAAAADITLAFTTAPSITGSAAVGSTLTAVKAPLNDADAAVTGYQWQSSTDGTTWSAISGATNQTYTPVAPDQGHQLRVIETATDADGGPTTTSSPSTATSAIGAGTSSLFAANATPINITENDPSAVDLGVKFQASTSGTITGIRFYKGPQNTGTHIGSLWSSSGTLLASASFTNETASGWQQVSLSTPVSITAGTTYIASYEAPNGEYSEDDNYFSKTLTNGPLIALATSSSGGNGVYAYGTSSPFPNNTYSGANYWVDVLFTPSSSTSTGPAPTGFTFSPATSTLQTLQGGSSLAVNTQIGNFTQTGGVAGDTFTYTLLGSTVLALSSSGSKGTLSTGSSGAPANTVSALSIEVNDLSNGATTSPMPFDIVTGGSGADTINANTSWNRRLDTNHTVRTWGQRRS